MSELQEWLDVVGTEVPLRLCWRSSCHNEATVKTYYWYNGKLCSIWLCNQHGGSEEKFNSNIGCPIRQEPHYEGEECVN